MSPLPEPDDALAIEDEAARAEVDRLKAMPELRLAITIMPAIGAIKPGSGTDVGIEALSRWLLRDYPRGARFHPLLRSVVREACAALVQIGLAEEGGAAYVAGSDGIVTAPGGFRPTALGARLITDGQLDQWVAYRQRKELRDLTDSDDFAGTLQDYGWQIYESGADHDGWPGPRPRRPQ